jgi:hypothetical protein
MDSKNGIHVEKQELYTARGLWLRTVPARIPIAHCSLPA